MSNLGYTVKAYGLYKFPEKQKHGTFKVEEFESALNEIFNEPRDRSFTTRTGPVGMAQFNEAINQAMRDQLITGRSTVRISNSGNISVGTTTLSDPMFINSTATAGIGTTTPETRLTVTSSSTAGQEIIRINPQGEVSFVERLIPMQDAYNLELLRTTQQQELLQTQLSSGQISAIEYLDLISNL